MRLKHRAWFILAFFAMAAMGLTQQTPNFDTLQSAKVSRIIDGDTVVLLLDGKKIKCRLIGIDTPETKHPQKPVEAYGKEASAFTFNLLKGETVWIETEPSNKQDKYGRLLAYLYRAPDGLFVNLEIVRQGYGHAYTRYPFKYMEEFRHYERRAREVGKGLWGSQSTTPASSIKSDQKTTADQTVGVYITRTGKKYHMNQTRMNHSGWNLGNIGRRG
jgi:micrococcal nuclease